MSAASTLWYVDTPDPAAVLRGQLESDPVAAAALAGQLYADHDVAPHMVGTGADAQAVADQMAETCLAFARTGRPDNPRIPAWPVYDLNRRATLVFDRTSTVVLDPRGGERRLFSPVPYVQPGT